MSTEIAKTEDRPSFLQESAPVGTDGLASKVRPSFVKIVQKQSNDEMIDLFGTGSIILSPDMELVCRADELATFVPLFYYVEYCKWAPLALKGQEPMIVERTFDPKHPVAIRSQSPATWKEDHPSHPGNPKYQYHYREHLNFIIKLTDEEHLHREPVLLSFSKTNYSVGQRLAKLVLQRRASIFAGKYDLGVRVRESAENAWRVYTIDNSQGGSWVSDKAEYDSYAAAHEYYKELQKSRDLDVSYDDESDIQSEQDVSEAEAPY